MLLLEQHRLIETGADTQRAAGRRVRITGETTKSMVSRVHSGAGM